MILAMARLSTTPTETPCCISPRPKHAEDAGAEAKRRPRRRPGQLASQEALRQWQEGLLERPAHASAPVAKATSAPSRGVPSPVGESEAPLVDSARVEGRRPRRRPGQLSGQETLRRWQEDTLTRPARASAPVAPRESGGIRAALALAAEAAGAEVRRMPRRRPGLSQAPWQDALARPSPTPSDSEAEKSSEPRRCMTALPLAGVVSMRAFDDVFGPASWPEHTSGSARRSWCSDPLDVACPAWSESEPESACFEAWDCAPCDRSSCSTADSDSDADGRAVVKRAIAESMRSDSDSEESTLGVGEHLQAR